VPEKISEEKLPKIDKEILELLTKEGEPISTYEVGKRIDISWSTANTHLMNLQIKGLVESEERESKGKKSRMWWVEQNSLDEFTG